MRVKYSQWHEDSSWTVANLEKLITKLIAEGWVVFDLAQVGGSRAAWFELPTGDSGIEIVVRAEDVPA